MAQFKNNTEIIGYLGLSPIPTADFPLITPPDTGHNTLANDDTNGLVRYDAPSNTWIPVADASSVHPPVAVGTTGTESAFITVDPVTQVLEYNVPAGTYYSQADVDALIATAKQETKDELIDGAPGTFDTLAEIAAELAADDTQATQIIADIASNDTDIAALQAALHDPVSVAATSDTEITIDAATQELSLDLSTVKADIQANANQIIDQRVRSSGADPVTDLTAALAELDNQVPVFYNTTVPTELTVSAGTISATENGVTTADSGSASIMVPMGVTVRVWKASPTVTIAVWQSAQDAVTLSATNDPQLSLVGQELTFTPFQDKFGMDFLASDFVVDPADATQMLYTITDARLFRNRIRSVEVLELPTYDRVGSPDLTYDNGVVELRVNAVPNAAFLGRINFVVSES